MEASVQSSFWKILFCHLRPEEGNTNSEADGPIWDIKLNIPNQAKYNDLNETSRGK